MKRSHYCGQVNETLSGTEVIVSGWVHHRRDHGGVIFIDLRDREGLVQIVFDPEKPDLFKLAESLRNEYVITVRGKVRPRPAGTENPNLTSGKIEIQALELILLNTSEPIPFSLDDYYHVGEAVRLQHRYLDLRRPEMQKRLKLRAAAARIIHQYMDANGFLEIETPMLTKTTPEGSRDYLVPSRTYPGEFYALPQSPQYLNNY